MEDQRPIYDEKGSQILVMALLAQTEAEKIAAIDGLIRHMGGNNSSAHDAKIFYATGSPGTWMSSVMGLAKRSQDLAVKAENDANRYRDRLVVLEGVIRRFRSILRNVDASTDQFVKWFMDAQPLNESDAPVTEEDKTIDRILNERISA